MKKFFLVFALFTFLGFASQAQSAAPKLSDKKEMEAPKEKVSAADKTVMQDEHKHDAKAACCANKSEEKAAGCHSSATASAKPKACCASKAAAATEGKAVEPTAAKKSKKRK